MSNKFTDWLQGAGVLYTALAGVIGVGVNLYSDVQLLKVENMRLSTATMELAATQSDVKVLQRDVTELKDNIIYLNSILVKSTDKMNEVLIKLERVADRDFKK